MSPIKNRTFLLTLLVTASCLYGCDTVELQSQWPIEPVVIDGSAAEWPETNQYLEEKSKVLVTVLNDENNIYIRLLTRNSTTQKMLLQAGLTTWIDYRGGNDKKFGVQFPLARKTYSQAGRNPDHKARNGPQEILEDSQRSLAILYSPQEDRPVRTISKIEATERGILATIDVQQGYMVYELQVPYSVTGVNKTVGIGFETGKMERPSGKGRSGGGQGGRGSGGGGGGGGGGMKGQGGGSQGGKAHGGGRPESFEMWAKVTLAEMPLSQYPAK